MVQAWVGHFVSSKVMQSIGDGDNVSVMLQNAVQTANNTAVYHLIQAGYDAQYLTAGMVQAWVGHFVSSITLP
jgi:hypothetical protein